MLRRRRGRSVESHRNGGGDGNYSGDDELSLDTDVSGGSRRKWGRLRKPRRSRSLDRDRGKAKPPTRTQSDTSYLGYGDNNDGPGAGESQDFRSYDQSGYMQKSGYSQSLASVSDIERLAQKKGANPLGERFKIMPDYAYPNTFMNREELRAEMNQKSVLFHDLRVKSKKNNEIGQLRVEILQCFGLPTTSLIREVSAYCVAVCGSYAFKTDTMPPVANPMWLCKMRRAMLFPVFHAYARLFIGVFDSNAEGSANYGNGDFIGRIVIDIARLRAGSMYDITLPLRQSAHVFTRSQQGAIRLRFHLIWQSERSALMSYWPDDGKPKLKKPSTAAMVHCLDDTSFRNVAHTVHGIHMPGKFSMSLMKATMRELNFTRIHVLRYLRKREIYHLMYWQYPFISGFVFLAVMHSVYKNSVRYVPGHILTFLLLHLYKNYAYYGLDSKLQNGFMQPTIEELLNSLMFGLKRRRKKFVQALDMSIDEKHTVNPMEHMEAHDDYDEANPDQVPIKEIAESMRKSLRVRDHTIKFRTYKNCFKGKEAVDFLCSFGFAYSREEAVSLGRRLAREVRLFDHVLRQQDFEDEDDFYQFLDFDTTKYVIKGHEPRGKYFLRAIGFMGHEGRVNEPRDHVEFPFATGMDHPRFTVKESLVIRSAEAKKLLRNELEAQDVADCAEFGVVPEEIVQRNVAGVIGNVGNVGLDVVKGSVGVGLDVVKGGVNVTAAVTSTVVKGGVGVVRAGARRASLVGGMVTGGMGGGGGGEKPPPPPNVNPTPADDGSASTEHPPPTPQKEKRNDSMEHSTHESGFRRMSMGFAPKPLTSTENKMEFVDDDEIYEKLQARQNATLDEILERQAQANTTDKYAYDSDDDVKEVQSKRNRGYIIEEKYLKKPPNQDISNKKINGGDKSFAKIIREGRHKAHGLLLHAFNDRTYQIDTELFPATLPEDKSEQDTSKSKKKNKKLGFGRRQSNQKEEVKKRKKKAPMTPFDTREDEFDKILGINKYSHGNPWINRVGVIVQPIVEIAQGWLFLFRALFNLFTWQDPILSFWVAVVGPALVLVLHYAPWRMVFFFAGFYCVGPQNYVIRKLRESRSDYEPPDFDKIVKKKKVAKDSHEEFQFFSSEAPGNQNIMYTGVEPKQVKRIVVPYSQLKYNRFYDWPPEPQYARVYASPPPRNSVEYNSDDEYATDGESYVYDATQTRHHKKKKKKGLKKIASKVKKGTGTVVVAGGELVGRTGGVVGGVALGAAHVTKSAVKGTANLTKDVTKGTVGTAGRFFGKKKKHDSYDSDDRD